MSKSTNPTATRRTEVDGYPNITFQGYAQLACSYYNPMELVLVMEHRIQKQLRHSHGHVTTLKIEMIKDQQCLVTLTHIASTLRTKQSNLVLVHRLVT